MPGQDDRDGVAPPAYAAEQAEAQPPVDVDTTAAFANLSLETNIAQRRLTVDTCLAHLKLLHAIHNLKEEVGYTDGLFGLHDSRAGHDADGFDLDAIHAGKGIKIEDAEKVKLALSKIREKRWALFVARAVDRYETWWRVIQGQNHLTQDMMAEPASDLYANFPILCKDPRGLGPDMLPPLGVYTHCGIDPKKLQGLTLKLPRRTYGVSFSYAQPSSISRGFHSKFNEGPVARWYALAPYQRGNRHKL